MDEKRDIPADELLDGADEDVETYIGPFAGYKRLKFQRFGQHKIYSPYRVTLRWWPDRNLHRAVCMMANGKAGHGHHDPPAFGCGCGYYAFWDYDDCFETIAPIKGVHTHEFSFLALVLGSGDVVLHDRGGFRSEYMEIAAIHRGGYAFERDLYKAADAMGVPVLGRRELIDYASEVGVIAPEL